MLVVEYPTIAIGRGIDVESDLASLVRRVFRHVESQSVRNACVGLARGCRVTGSTGSSIDVPL